MRNLKISISEVEYNKFGLNKNTLAFSEFVELVSKELTRQTLEQCVALAAKFGLSQMSMGDISKEVKAVRRNAKSNR